jgi:hypothetical protein
MNLNSLTGGLMMVALAAVWFIVFMPALSKRDQKTKATSQNRVLLTRRLLVLLGLAAVAGVVAAFVSGQGVIVSIGLGVIAVALGLVAGIKRIASARATRTVSPRVRVATGLTADQAEPEPVIEYRNPRAWQAGEFPSQTLRPTYAKLETPTLADVIKLSQPKELSSETLDEIMRRRRAN